MIMVMGLEPGSLSLEAIDLPTVLLLFSLHNKFPSLKLIGRKSCLLQMALKFEIATIIVVQKPAFVSTPVPHWLLKPLPLSIFAIVIVFNILIFFNQETVGGTQKKMNHFVLIIFFI